MSTHSRFSPSKLPRIIQCPGSVKLIEALRIEQTTSSAAEEGTYLHEVVEKHLRAQQYTVTTELHPEREKHLEYKEAVEDILSWVFSLTLLYSESKTFQGIEHKVSLSPYADQDSCAHLHDVAGTLDFMFKTERSLYICDWKFGKGVVVEPDSDQLKAYASAALLSMDCTEIRDVHLVIKQPRLPYDTHKSLTLTVSELNRWRKHVLVPALQLIDAETPVLNPSPKACMWCPLAKDISACRARYKMAQKTAEEVFAIHAKIPKGAADANSVTLEEIADILSKTPMLDQYIKDLNNYALRQLSSGKDVPGFKLVRGRSLRQWANEELAKEQLEDAGYDVSELSEVKFFSPAKVEKVIGKKKAQEDFFTSLVIKPEGKITMTHEGDKRPAIACDAATVFAELAESTEN